MELDDLQNGESNENVYKMDIHVTTEAGFSAAIFFSVVGRMHHAPNTNVTNTIRTRLSLSNKAASAKSIMTAYVHI